MTDRGGASDKGLHFPRSAPIDSYGNGGFRFADMSHRGSLLCLPDSLWAWDVTSPAQIDGQALARVLARADEIDTLIIGTGAAPALFPPPLRQTLREAGIVVDVMQTGPAIRVYNIMIGERRRVAAGLIAVP